jgi:hypothetical protein
LLSAVKWKNRDTPKLCFKWGSQMASVFTDSYSIYFASSDLRSLKNLFKTVK